jgi:exodeoxyribonuclease V gamma subunit
MIQDDGGLIVHRGSRTERLAEKLAAALEAGRPANPLQAQTVVVAHLGLRRWLLGQFARRPGIHNSHGIAANFDMILPWQWLERVARDTLGDVDLIDGAYRRQLLRWHIFRALPAVDSSQLAAYLGGPDGERRRFQLAEHLAGVYTQYLIYRPDWIIAWERGPTPAEHWQATLWRKLQAPIAAPHRAQRQSALCKALATRGDGDHSPLHVFGVSHLAPDIFAALRALAMRRCVHLYFPDPCREYWADLRSRRETLKLQADPAALYYEVGHPLLVSLGRMAQDFCISLDEADAAIERDALDDAEPLPGANGLLARLQTSIRCCQPDLVGAEFRANADFHINVDNAASREASLLALRTDASLRTHACHTRLRELEALKDALLGALAEDATLQHRDIVVMAPNIDAYAAYLPAVFGAAARYDADPALIPWHLADVGLARTHPLMTAFQRTLDLAESRFAASDVLDFLDVPAVARRFGIDAEGREALERSLRRARIAWGLDADMKAQAGAAPIAANSWQFGFDRMYAGLLLGQDTPAATFDGILPLEGIGGSVAEALGQLDRLLGQLRRARDGFALARPLAAWSAWLLDLIDALFLADPRDDDEQTALDALRRVVADLAAQGDAAGADALPWSVIRDALRGALDEVSERQPFLLGGVTFCGLVPQRSIPFRMVCLIGMNEGEFPRASGDAGLNRMLVEPRPGDRDSRSEDRYLFLEALMSARDRLHVSYIGEGVRDAKPRNPASPLAELTQFLDAQHGLQADDDTPRPWLLQHPLQPFDVRYYRRENDIAADGTTRHDPRLFSYVRTFADLPVAGAPRVDGFFDPAANTSVTEQSGADISLTTLKQYWRDPARDVLLRGIGVSLEAVNDDHWPDREPLLARVDRRERIDRQLFFDALAAGETVVPATPPPWLALSGLLAAGVAGELAYTQARDAAAAVLAPARAVLGENPQREAQAVDLDLGDGLRLSGIVENVFRKSDGRLCLFDAKPGGEATFKELLPFFVDLAALRLGLSENPIAEFVENVKKSTTLVARQPALLDSIVNQSREQMRDGLRRLIRASVAAHAIPALYFPKTAWEWATAASGPARKAWEGGGFKQRGERDYAPGYAGVVARDLDFLDPDSTSHPRFIAAVELVADVLDPQRQVLLRGAAQIKARAREQP